MKPSLEFMKLGEGYASQTDNPCASNCRDVLSTNIRQRREIAARASPDERIRLLSENALIAINNKDLNLDLINNNKPFSDLSREERLEKLLKVILLQAKLEKAQRDAMGRPVQNIMKNMGDHLKAGYHLHQKTRAADQLPADDEEAYLKNIIAAQKKLKAPREAALISAYTASNPIKALELAIASTRIGQKTIEEQTSIIAKNAQQVRELLATAQSSNIVRQAHPAQRDKRTAFVVSAPTPIEAPQQAPAATSSDIEPKSWLSKLWTGVSTVLSFPLKAVRAPFNTAAQTPATTNNTLEEVTSPAPS